MQRGKGEEGGAGRRGVPFDFEERSELFALEVRALIRRLPRTLTNRVDAVQLARASGSVAANYIEAVEAISKKDLVHRLRICRKEAKEARLHLRLVHTGDDTMLNADRQMLEGEATELLAILTTMIKKLEPTARK